MREQDLNYLAEKAYADYSSTTNGKDLLGRDLPVWAALPEVLQAAWVAVAFGLEHRLNVSVNLQRNTVEVTARREP